MKECMVCGDMQSEKSSENYPIEIVCDECASIYSEGDEPRILSVEGASAEDYDVCYFCEKTYDEEFVEKHGSSKEELEEELQDLQEKLSELQELEGESEKAMASIDAIAARITEIERVLD